MSWIATFPSFFFGFIPTPVQNNNTKLITFAPPTP